MISTTPACKFWSSLIFMPLFFYISSHYQMSSFQLFLMFPSVSLTIWLSEIAEMDFDTFCFCFCYIFIFISFLIYNIIYDDHTYYKDVMRA